MWRPVWVKLGSKPRLVGADAGDLTGAEIDHQVELGVGGAEGRGDDGAVIGIAGHRLEGFIVSEEPQSLSR